MKSFTIAAIMAPTAAFAQWWGGAPECAQTCLSSAWTAGASTYTSGSVTTTAPYWPAQSDFCEADKGASVGNCISSACGSTLTAYSSYTSLSASLCSRYDSCTSAGSTGVQTITYSGGAVTWGAPGGWGGFGKGGGFGGYGGNGGGPGGDGHGPWGSGGWGGPDSTYWSEWASAWSGSKTWTGGVVTVTGCAFQGSPWFVGPDCGWNGQGGFNGWVGWGSGWSWGPTETKTLTVTKTDSAGSQITSTGIATVALAVSGDITTSTTISAESATTTPDAPNAAARVGGPGPEGGIVTGMLAVALGAVALLAGFL